MGTSLRITLCLQGPKVPKVITFLLLFSALWDLPISRLPSCQASLPSERQSCPVSPAGVLTAECSCKEAVDLMGGNKTMSRFAETESLYNFKEYSFIIKVYKGT